jgi:peroxiredoxin
MVQLHHDKSAFDERDTIIVVVGPEDHKKFQDYWVGKEFSFYGIPNGKETVMKDYEQDVKLLKAGRMPAQFLIDKEGIVRYAHFANSMKDIPDNKEILKIIDQL